MKTVALSFLLLIFTATAYGTNEEKLFDDMISAIDANNISRVKSLLSKGIKPNLTVDSRASPTFLTRSAYRGHNAIIRALVIAGADLEAVNGDGYTPLMMAVFGGHPETVRLFLSHRVNVNAVSARGETPLSLARGSKNSQVISLLVKAGAKE